MTFKGEMMKSKDDNEGKNHTVNSSIEPAQTQARFRAIQAVAADNCEIHHRWHFVLTLLSFGVWGIVWWRLILKSQGKEKAFFHGFDDAYWSHLIEREQPPAALHKLQIDDERHSVNFDA